MPTEQFGYQTCIVRLRGAVGVEKRRRVYTFTWPGSTKKI